MSRRIEIRGQEWDRLQLRQESHREDDSLIITDDLAPLCLYLTKAGDELRTSGITHCRTASVDVTSRTIMLNGTFLITDVQCLQIL